MLVVAGDGIGAVFVLFVVFVPGVEAGLGEGLPAVAGVSVHSGDGFGQYFEIGGRADAAAAYEE